MDMDTQALQALSPLDGRYSAAVAPLRTWCSEAALIRERIRIEASWLLALSAATPNLPGSRLAAAVRAALDGLSTEPPVAAAVAVKKIEQRTNHDVKAVEYYVRECLQDAGADSATLELVHFGCTSEDINNLAYARLLRAARDAVLLPHIDELWSTLSALTREHAALPMLARTHGQAASPTTLGKEVANVAARLARLRRRWAQVAVLGKWNGAVGNFNAQALTLPAIDWPELARRFVESQQLEYNPLTTQIEPHDWIAEYSDAAAAINVVLIDLCRDLWGYISLGYLRQRVKPGEVGSSTMPHKVNPIDFENAEGNFGVANALLRHLSDKLPISRWQRDLTDSTVLRNVGVALGHSLVGYVSLSRGLAKLSPDTARLAADLQQSWEVLGEAVQTVLRAAGIPNGYERLKDFTRGRPIDAALLHAFIDELPLGDADKQQLKRLTPATYIGVAAQLARTSP